MQTTISQNGQNGTTKPAIVSETPKKSLSEDELLAQLEALEAENKALRSARDQGVRIDVNKSGNVRVRVEGASYAMPAKHAKVFLENTKLLAQAIDKAEKGSR